MLKNHLLITLRRLSRKKGYAFLNVFGLALGLAVFGILILFVRYETSYEQFHENVDRIHLVYTEQGPEFQRSSSDRLSIPYGRILEESVPEVERMVRTMGAAFNAVRVDGEIIVPTDLRAFFVDQAVFQIFTFPLVAGDSQSALNNPRTAVIDHGTAIQLFGTDDPNEVMGRCSSRQGEPFVTMAGTWIGVSDSQRSVSIAAIHPVLAAVTAWRYTWSCASPEANTPSMLVFVEPGFVMI